MGWMELLVVGVVALIVVGPKDLPVMFQSLGKMSAKVKRMAREFQGAMNDAANSTGVGDIAKDLKGLTSPKALGIDKLKDVADNFDKWEPGKAKPGPETAKLSEERAEAARKIREKTAEVAQARLDREAAEAEEAAPAETAAAKPKAAKTAAETKPAAKPRPAVKPKPAAKTKPAATAKPVAKTPPAAKPKPAPKAKTAPKAKPKAKPAARSAGDETEA